MRAMKDRFRGCLLGGAAGDALGYTVEFWDESQIRRHFGAEGIRRYVLRGGYAIISDDTQMTLYTANGLLCGAVEKGSEDTYINCIYRCYLDWLDTQERADLRPREGKIAWLNRIGRLNVRRAPGNTCLGALQCGTAGSIQHPLNNSKGCGGVMRTAPIGLLFTDEGVCQRLGAKAAALTHGHALGYLPAALLSDMVYLLVNGECDTVREAAARALQTLRREFADECDLQTMIELIERAVSLADSDLPDVGAIHKLGEGWVGDEALAIAVYCAVKYENDFEGCLRAAVNHCGDSDSTGAIAGNILGAKLGLAGIPEYYLENLELREEIQSMADDLFEARRTLDGAEAAYDWTEKYRTAKPDQAPEESKNAEEDKSGSITDDILKRLLEKWIK